MYLLQICLEIKRKGCIFASVKQKQSNMKQTEAYKILMERGIRPSLQRLAIMDYLIHHPIHPTVDDVYQGLNDKVPTLSRTTVYNTLRMLSDKRAAQMITIDDHRVCYDGNTKAHVHFFCKQCGKVIDLFEEQAPELTGQKIVEGNIITEEQLYYKGICSECAKKAENKK